MTTTNIKKILLLAVIHSETFSNTNDYDTLVNDILSDTFSFDKNPTLFTTQTSSIFDSYGNEYKLYYPFLSALDNVFSSLKRTPVKFDKNIVKFNPASISIGNLWYISFPNWEDGMSISHHDDKYEYINAVDVAVYDEYGNTNVYRVATYWQLNSWELPEIEGVSFVDYAYSTIQVRERCETIKNSDSVTALFTELFQRVAENSNFSNDFVEDTFLSLVKEINTLEGWESIKKIWRNFYNANPSSTYTASYLTQVAGTIEKNNKYFSIQSIEYSIYPLSHPHRNIIEITLLLTNEAFDMFPVNKKLLVIHYEYVEESSEWEVYQDAFVVNKEAENIEYIEYTLSSQIK